jgi:hypothetical protein
MKAFIAILAFATVANAGTRIEHDYSAALGEIALENACVTATTVESKTAVKHCAKLAPVVRNDGDNEYTDWVCVDWRNEKLRYSRNYSVTECTDLREVGHGEGSYLQCFKYESVAKYLPTTVKVRFVTEHGDYSNWPGETKNFTFPTCN